LVVLILTPYHDYGAPSLRNACRPVADRCHLPREVRRISYASNAKAPQYSSEQLSGCSTLFGSKTQIAESADRGLN
jgi:hypothetical protein